MDYRVSWSPEAVDDVEAIAEYIERDSPIYARAVVQKLLDAARDLNTFPNAGRIVPEFGDDAIRERFVYSYRSIYRVREHTVLVAALIHGKRMLEKTGSREANERRSDYPFTVDDIQALLPGNIHAQQINPR